jgi:SAM-dependent methyltransferase
MCYYVRAMPLRDIAKSILPRPLRNAIRFAMWQRADAAYTKETGQSGFPPAYLRVRVHGNLDIPSFFQAGERCADDIMTCLKDQGTGLIRFKRILDFGCGSGRTLKALHERLPDSHLFGTDTDPDAIRWDKKNLNFGEYPVNGFEPPLTYPDDQFDLIYAISVFTHIDERLQFLWLEELKRVSAQGSLLLLTVHGPDVPSASSLTAEQKAQYEKDGFLFVRDKSWSDLFPDYYQTTYHTRKYIEANWTRYFEIVDYRERSMDGLQDVVVVRPLK